MSEKGGLVDKILKSAEDLGRDAGQGVHRKKITLDDLNKVIVEYVHKTAGMGDPELRGRIVQMELQMGTLREQAAAVQRALDQARAGWKASQDQLRALSRDPAALGASAPDPSLAQARKEASEAREDAARAKGRLAVLEAQGADWGGKYAALQQKTEKFAARLDEALRSEKKARADLQAVEQKAQAAGEAHRREAEALQDRIETLSAGFDYVELLPDVDADALVERAKAGGVRAGELSVDASPAAREALERLEARFGALRLALEALREEAAARRRAVDDQAADFPAVLRLAEIHRRFEDADGELAGLEGVVEAFAPEDPERR